MPNVGKSSFFNLMTKLNVPAENYPFCTIDPSEAKVPVPDKRFNWLCQHYKPKSEVKAVLTIHDIAGLVKGAAEGAGLGNAFLSHVRATDAIYHMVRAFDNKEVSHVEESVDPIRDMDIIHSELRFKDVEQAKKAVEALGKNIRGPNGKEIKAEQDFMKKVLKHLEEDKKDVRAGQWNSKEIEWLNKHYFLTAKPMIYLVNLNKNSYKKKTGKWLPKIAEYVEARGCGEKLIPMSVAFETKIFEEELNGGLAAKQAFIKAQGARGCLPRIIHAGYDALDLVHYFTSGKDEVKCWTIRRGTLAPQAAGVIHTDFEKGFICAEVTAFEDFKKCGTEQKAKAEGKTRQQGKTYEVLDGDMILFKFNN